MHSSLSRQEHTDVATNQAFWNTPPEGHWGYPIVEEAPSMTPLQETIHILEVTPDSSRPHFFEEHLTLIMDICRDVADLLFRQECLNRQLDFLYDALSGEPASNHCLVCHQPYNIVPTWHQHTSGGNDIDTIGA
jgi:hypothetical protein